MSEKPNVLRLRVLLSLVKEDSETCTVTGIAKTLGEEKYTVSRILTGLEKEGLLDRSDIRHPALTEEGRKVAQVYGEKIRITMNHLIYEGVDVENAKSDAYSWALYNTEQTMEVIRKGEEQYRVKYELRGKHAFSGAELCEKLKDGIYRFPFIIYREHVRNGSNLSMSNEGFEHPCILQVKNGKGTIQLRAVKMKRKSGVDGKIMSGRVKSMKYLEEGVFVNAETSGDILSFPASVLNFVNIGEGIGQILHGSVCLKMTCSVGVIHMPESKAIFTMLI